MWLGTRHFIVMNCNYKKKCMDWSYQLLGGTNERKAIIYKYRCLLSSLGSTSTSLCPPSPGELVQGPTCLGQGTHSPSHRWCREWVLWHLWGTDLHRTPPNRRQFCSPSSLGRCGGGWSGSETSWHVGSVLMTGQARGDGVDDRQARGDGVDDWDRLGTKIWCTWDLLAGARGSWTLDARGTCWLVHVEVDTGGTWSTADWYTWRLTLEARGALLTGTRGRLTLELLGLVDVLLSLKRKIISKELRNMTINNHDIY